MLFEMLTGRACFDDGTVTDVLAAVMRADPDWTLLPAATPPHVRELLERCLAKDRRQRLHDIGDARLELEQSASESPATASAQARAGWFWLSPAAGALLPPSRPMGGDVVGAVSRTSAGRRDWRIRIVDLQAGTIDKLDLQGVAARYVKPGHLVVTHDDGSLAVVPFDLKSLRPDGPAMPLSADRTSVLPQTVQGQIDVTDDGTLLYWASRAGDLSHPVFVDRQARPTSSRCAPD